MDPQEDSLIENEAPAAVIEPDVVIEPQPAAPTMKRKRLKKFLSYSVIGLFLFLTGVQYVLILPTAYDYIVVQLHGDSNLYGIALAAYSLSALFANLVFGWLSDGIISVKVSATISNVFLCAGSFMYFMGINVWFIILSRFVCGIGTGAGTSFWADLARNTPENEKTKVFSIIMLCRQLGVVAGPGFTLLFKTIFLSTPEYVIGPFKLNIDSMPGLFMAGVWVIMLVFCLAFYTDLENFVEKPQSPRRVQPLNVGSESLARRSSDGEGEDKAVHFESDDDDDDEEGDKDYQPPPRISVITNVRPHYKPTWRDYFQALSTEDVICLQFVLFISGFVQTALEALLPPMSLTLLEWGENQTSLWFLISGAITICIFLLVSGPLTRLFHDYSLTIFGVFVEILSFPFLIVMSLVCVQCCPGGFRIRPNDPDAMGLLLAGFTMNNIGLPFIASCTVSLFSNAIDEEYQGMAHGIRRSLSYVGFLLGPLWAGAYTTYLPQSFSAFMGSYMIALVLLFASKNTLFT